MVKTVSKSKTTKDKIQTKLIIIVINNNRAIKTPKTSIINFKIPNLLTLSILTTIQINHSKIRPTNILDKYNHLLICVIKWFSHHNNNPIITNLIHGKTNQINNKFINKRIRNRFS